MPRRHSFLPGAYLALDGLGEGSVALVSQTRRAECGLQATQEPALLCS